MRNAQELQPIAVPALSTSAPSPLSSLTGVAPLVQVIQALSLARSVDAVMAIVRTAARQLTGADGATFVLRDGDRCYYADEDAISPLWKGQRFPMSACISGWAMLNRQPVMIEDIYQDPRIPVDAYRPTFVKSLVMVPIRTEAPLGAIGVYWSNVRRPRVDEMNMLQTLANSTAISLENVELYVNLEARVQERTAQLEALNRELDAFSYSVSHDLRAPLRAIQGFGSILLEEDNDRLSETGKAHLGRIQNATRKMGELIDALLSLSRLSQTPLLPRRVDLASIAEEVIEGLRSSDPLRKVEVVLPSECIVMGDSGLLRVLLTNLLSNAWKFTRDAHSPKIELGMLRGEGAPEIFVKDNGAGFNQAYAAKLFGPFQRLHTQSQFPGTGIGLATVARIVARHGGRIRAEGVVGQGATFFFSLNAAARELPLIRPVE